jgi:hypothetical protein
MAITRFVVKRIQPPQISLEEWLAYVSASQFVRPALPRNGVNPFTKEAHVFKPRPGAAYFDTPAGRSHISFTSASLIIRGERADAAATVAQIAESLGAVVETGGAEASASTDAPDEGNARRRSTGLANDYAQKLNVDFSSDLPKIRAYIASRALAHAADGQWISAVEVGFRLCQAGLLVLNFDVREDHKRDGTWTLALNGPTLELPNWRAAYESAQDAGVSFDLFSGEHRDIPPRAGDSVIAGVFGEALLAVALDSISGGSFAALPLADNCQLDLDEFDGMWSWPKNFGDLGRVNLICDLPSTRLPK